MSDDKLPSLIRDLGSRQKRVNDINRYCEDQYRKNRIQGFAKSQGYSSDALIFLAQSICKASTSLTDKIVDENRKIQSMMEGLKMANMALLECRKGVLSRSTKVAGRGEMFDLGEKRFTLQGSSVPVDSRQYSDFAFTRTSRVLERIEQDRIIVNDSDRERMRWNYKDTPSKQTFKSTAKGLAVGSVMDLTAARNRPLSFAEPTPRRQTTSNFQKNNSSSRGRRAPPPRREDVPAGRGPSPPRRRQAPPRREPSNVELSSEDEDSEPPAPMRRTAPPSRPSASSSRRAPPPRKPASTSERRAPPPRKPASTSERRAPPPRKPASSERAPPPRRSAPPARRQAPPPRSTSSSSSSSSSSGGGGAFAKYQKMLNMHIPMPAVVSKMRGDGFSDSDIRAFKSGGGSSGGGRSAPVRSGPKKKMGGGLLASIQKGKKLKKTKTVVKDGTKKSASKPRLTGKPRNPMEEMMMMREKMKNKKKKKKKTTKRAPKVEERRAAPPPRRPSPKKSRAPPPPRKSSTTRRAAPPPRRPKNTRAPPPKPSSRSRAPPPRRSAPPARRQAPPPRSTSSSSSSSSSGGGGALAKYQKMLNMHIPMPAVVSKMRGDGFSDSDIRAFKSGGGSSGGGRSAPVRSGPIKKMGGGLLASIQKGKKLKKTKTVVKDGTKKSASKPRLTGKPRNPMEEMMMMRQKMKNKKKKKKRRGAPPMKKLW